MHLCRHGQDHSLLGYDQTVGFLCCAILQSGRIQTVSLKLGEKLGEETKPTI